MERVLLLNCPNPAPKLLNITTYDLERGPRFKPNSDLDRRGLTWQYSNLFYFSE